MASKRKLEIKIQSLELENELLAMLNENLRRWLLANTRAAINAGGYDDRSEDASGQISRK